MGKVLVERKKKEKEKRGGGWLGYDFFKRRMTERQCVLYREQVERSECFDVQTPRSVTDCGLIRPVSRRAEMKRYSLLAINKYNNLRSKQEPETPRLKFVKVLKAMSEVCNVARFYITFEAKEEDSAGGQTKTYQTVVHKPPASMPVTVLSFRECEREKGSGNIRGKDWVWKGHTSI